MSSSYKTTMSLFCEQDNFLFRYKKKEQNDDDDAYF